MAFAVGYVQNVAVFFTKDFNNVPAFFAVKGKVFGLGIEVGIVK